MTTSKLASSGRWGCLPPWLNDRPVETGVGALEKSEGMTKSDLFVTGACCLVDGKRSVYDGYQGNRIREFTQKSHDIAAAWWSMRFRRRVPCRE